MMLGSQIAYYRKRQNITQEALAQQLGVTNQAVSKWESDQCCPDVMLLPKLADVFHISLDELFGKPAAVSADLPWEDDDTLHAVLFVGHRLMEAHPACREVTFRYEGDALNIQSNFSVSCGDIEGDVHANGSVNCGDIEGEVHAGGNVFCGDVEGNAQAGGNVACGDVEGNVTAGGDVTCGDVEGSIMAGRNVRNG